MGLFDFISRAFPPSYQEVTATKSWKVTLLFGSDPDLLREAISQVKLNIGWQARLELSTTDIIDLMRKGLYVSQENVIVQESCMTWKGNLVVTTLSCPVATNFRVEHLSADKIFRSYASDVYRTQCWVYHFMINNPEVNANYILDDTPLKGLWPWPRNEHVIQEREEEREQTKERIEEADMLDLL
ncbi:hypothetical protein ACJA88_009787 [Fusarium oxysporum]